MDQHFVLVKIECQSWFNVLNMFMYSVHEKKIY